MPVSSTAPPASAEHRIPELDGIRGIAILFVLISHFGIPFTPGETVSSVISFGWAGVDIFFVLSGYLITGILLASRGDSQYFSRFYIRRAFRIFPVYYAFLILFFHVGPMLSRIHGFSFLSRGPGQEWWYWLYLSNWSPFPTRNRGLEHFWSLCVEEQFYLFFPFVVRYCSRRTLKIICLWAVVLSPLMRFAGAEFGISPFRLYQETVFRLDGLALGAVLAIARDDESLRCAVQRWSKTVALASAVVFAFVIWRYGVYFVSEPMTVWGHTAVHLLAAALIFHATAFPRTLRMSWLRSLGKYSYAIYVWHFPIAEQVAFVARKYHDRISPGALWIAFPAGLVAGIGLSWSIGWISWQVLEKPCARLKERITGTRVRRPVFSRTQMDAAAPSTIPPAEF